MYTRCSFYLVSVNTLLEYIRLIKPTDEAKYVFLFFYRKKTLTIIYTSSFLHEATTTKVVGHLERFHPEPFS